MKVELSDEAQRHVSEIDTWWRANRDKAPNLFAEELEEALGLLESVSRLGTKYDEAKGVRRLGVGGRVGWAPQTRPTAAIGPITTTKIPVGTLLAVTAAVPATVAVTVTVAAAVSGNVVRRTGIAVVTGR